MLTQVAEKLEVRAPSSEARRGADILIEALRVHGTDTAFCVPGESYLSVLDALYNVRNEIRLIVCRHEAGAAIMAEAHGKLTGRPGICFVTRGPGATHASTAIHTAQQDSTPMILFIGQVSRGHAGREAFQEIDYRHMFGHMAKWVEQIDNPRRIPEFIGRAFQTATAGRPGPVVLALPEDMLTEICVAPGLRPYKAVRPAPAAEQMTELAERLGAAKRPLMIVGGSGWTAGARHDLAAFARTFTLPGAAAFRFQDLIDNRDIHYVGDIGVGINPALAERVRQADLLLIVGARLGEATTGGYTLIEAPIPRQSLVHVHAGVEELGSVYQGDQFINSGMPQFALAARNLTPKTPVRWTAWTEAARRDYLAWIEPPHSGLALDLAAVMVFLRNRLPADAIVCNGAGNYTAWLHRFYQYSGFRTQLAPTSGAMGYGLPAAIAAALIHPDRTVVAFGGDGCFLMNVSELATAVRERLKILCIVVNNGSYGTIRMHQEMRFPHRTYGTDLTNPDFASLARAFGMPGELVENTDAFPEAFERAMAVSGPALIELRTDVEAITPRTTINALRLKAQEPAST
jgi:acetolactate synthase-1/2/3 large subunit